MPQLVPFFFLHESITVFILISIMVYISSKYILPRFVRLFYTRILLKKI